MKLKDIFAKNVQRSIEGVIKADDERNLATEVEEYVLTNEASKRVEAILEEYTHYQSANGVWISGFFGSGKSHLLKMLAHLLGDVHGQGFSRDAVHSSFYAKAQGAFLPALLDKARAIPAKSLLFNIDQKATLISKDQLDAILKVFVKVFDESRGYYGSQGYVARFERDLDNRGQYEKFKDAYRTIASRAWEVGREEGVLEETNVAKAYAQISETAPDNILAKYRHDYALSIEDFANEVRAWLDQQPSGTRLNFFVDEVGQFIGTNGKLMLNLQTIAESLATKCGGRAWVFVTSQEDMEKVLGDITKQQGNDFSKIQARFKIRAKLSSADVEEVIRKRLLEKNVEGAAALEPVYSAQHGNFKTLFNFPDGAKKYKSYTDEAHFIGTYPFVGYQFPMFQEAIESLSDHNAFEGKNSSVGERSMLGVVQQVAKDIGDLEVGRLATFDHMYAGIQAALKSAAQSAVNEAEKQIDDNPLAIRLLKALFLVKYIDSFQATPRNLTVLVYDRFDLDLPRLQSQVKEALDLLEARTYIQRNGEIYAYLTKEEQDIEAEIKGVDIDGAEVTQRLVKLLTGGVLTGTKYRNPKTNQDFPFGIKLDDQNIGQQHDLTVHFITPEYPASEEEVRLQSSGRDEVCVLLNPDIRTFADLRLFIKTEKYTKHKQTGSLSSSIELILRTKSAQNAERERELVERLRKAVGTATLVIKAADVPSTATDPVARVNEGLQDLISKTYTNIGMLGGMTYTDLDIPRFAQPPDKGILEDAGLTKLAEPGGEIFSHLTQQEAFHIQVTIKSIVERFSSKPYGWDRTSILALIAWLVGQGKITVSLDGGTLRRSEVASVLRNTQKQAQTIVKPQKTFDEQKVAAFRKFYSDFFDQLGPHDALELARVASEGLRKMLDEVRGLQASANYPLLRQLSDPIEQLATVTGKPLEWYLSDFPAANVLLDFKDQVIAPIQSFMNGPQRQIYDNAEHLLAHHAINLQHFNSQSEAAAVRGYLDDENAFRGNRMQQLKLATEALSKALEAMVAERRSDAIRAINDRKDALTGTLDYLRASEPAQQQALQVFERLAGRIAEEDQIAQIGFLRINFEDNEYPALLDRLRVSHPSEPNSQEGSSSEAIRPTVSIKTVHVATSMKILETAEDVEKYMAAVREALLGVLQNQKRISL